MRLPRRILCCVSGVILALLCGAAAAPTPAQSPVQMAQPWHDAVHSLAQQIAGAPSVLTLSVQVSDLTAHSPVDPAILRRALEEQLRIQGVRVNAPPPPPSAGSPPTPATAGAAVRVTIAENLEGYLLVAQIQSSGAPAVAIAAVAQSAPVPSPAASGPVLHRQIVWQQPRPIMDFATGVSDANRTLWYILEPDRLVAYEFSGDSEVLTTAQPFSRAYTSRDARGKLELRSAAQVTAWIAAVRCDGFWNPGFSLDCTANASRQWPMGGESWTYDPSHNYFSGAVSLSNSLTARFPAFFSAASPPPQTSSHGPSQPILAGLDGRAQLFAGGAQPVAILSGWGSDIVSLASACHPAWQVLVTGTGDWTQPDRIQLYEIADGQAEPVGAPLEFPGPVLTLWQADDGQSARAVSRNLRTGMYEASIITSSCNL